VFVSSSDALKTTTNFITRHKYAQHHNFKDYLPKIKYKPAYKRAISFFFLLKKKGKTVNSQFKC